MDSYTVAILIIGSLIWDEREHRESWRQERLKGGPGIPVAVPIRYGRRSDKRGKTYTMVLSNELLTRSPAGTGWALAMPCRSRVTTAEQLVTEARALWAAEQSCPSKPGRLSATWGAVGLLPNPAQTTLNAIIAGWVGHVAKEKNYPSFCHADDEQAAVDPKGILTIPWPNTKPGVPLDVDLLLATATQPSLDEGAYASPEAVAEAWRQAPAQQRYFSENRRVGVTTADDDRIMKYLRQKASTSQNPSS